MAHARPPTRRGLRGDHLRRAGCGAEDRDGAVRSGTRRARHQCATSERRTAGEADAVVASRRPRLDPLRPCDPGCTSDSGVVRAGATAVSVARRRGRPTSSLIAAEFGRAPTQRLAAISCTCRRRGGMSLGDGTVDARRRDRTQRAHRLGVHAIAWTRRTSTWSGSIRRTRVRCDVARPGST